MNKATGLKRLVNAAGYSWSGIISAFKSEAAFRQELLLACFLIPLAFWLGDTGVEYVLMIAPVILVLVIELLNSAIEAVVDRFGGELHELSGKAKDLGSAAVFMSLVLLVLSWGLVLLSP